MKIKYRFFTSSLADRYTFFCVCIDGQMFKAINGQSVGMGPVCLLDWFGEWEKQQDGFVKDGWWKDISPEEAMKTIPDGYQSNFPFPQLLK